MIAQALKITLKLQPAVVLFSCVSVCSKLASRQLPSEAASVSDYMLLCLKNWKLLLLLALMIFLLGIYALIWQMIIKKAKIAVVYANKSSYLFWTQLAAFVIFGENISFYNIVGIAIIFTGVILGNSEAA